MRCLLVRNGIMADLKVGFSRQNPPAGHAWVEIDGQPVLDSRSRVDEFPLRLEPGALLSCKLSSSARLRF